jgi:HSP20 family molecular chaperone IbpA
MDDSNKETRKNFEDMIRQIIEQSMAGTIDQPGVFGFKIIISGAGIPSGNGAGGSSFPDTRETPVEVFTIGDEVLAVTELPGLNPEQVSITFEEDVLFIRGSDGSLTYEAQTRLPPVNRDSIKASMKNGVLEVTFASLNTPELDVAPDFQPGE